jgi:hypothetical protein
MKAYLLKESLDRLWNYGSTQQSVKVRILRSFLTSGVTQKRPMRVTSKPANGNEARGR